MRVKSLKVSTGKVNFSAGIKGIKIPKVGDKASLDRTAREISAKTKAWARKVKV